MTVLPSIPEHPLQVTVTIGNAQTDIAAPRNEEGIPKSDRGHVTLSGVVEMFTQYLSLGISVI